MKPVRSRWAGYGWIAVAILAAVVSAALAEVTEEAIHQFMSEWKRGEALYNDYDYEGALAVLEPALADVRGFPEGSQNAFRAELIDGYRYLAFSAIALEQYDKATAAFVHILELDREFDPGEVSPKIRAVFDKATERIPGLAPVRIHHDPIRTFKAGEPITIRASIKPKPQSITVFYKSAWWVSYKETTMLDVGEGIYVAVIPGRSTKRAKKIQYYIEARNGIDSEPSRAGDARNPLVIVEGADPSGESEPDIPETGLPDEF